MARYTAINNLPINPNVDGQDDNGHGLVHVGHGMALYMSLDPSYTELSIHA